MAKFPLWGVGTDVNATNLANTVPNIVTKASANTITSNATLANDGELQNIALEAGTWEIEVKLWVAAAIAATFGDLKTAWAFTTGTLTGTPDRECMGPGSGSTAAATALVNLNLSVLSYNTSVTYPVRTNARPFQLIREEANNFVVATAGNLAIQVAQATSSATSTVIQAGSRVKCRRIA